MGDQLSKGNTSNNDKQIDQALTDTPQACRYFNDSSCTVGSLCEQKHICSTCFQGGHTKKDCPFIYRVIPSFENWSHTYPCWSYNFSTAGCPGCWFKKHKCNVCKEYTHGNLNCPQIRKKRGALLKDLLPSMEEWETETTCWFYNFSTEGCSKGSLCEKQHTCRNCLQPGHPLLTCPEPIAEKLATRAALKQEEAMKAKKHQDDERARKQIKLKQKEEMKAKKQQELDEEKLWKQKKEEEMRVKKQQELDEEKLRKQKKKTLQQEEMRENQRELEEEQKKIQEIKDEEKALLEKLESSRNSSRKAVEATIECSMQTHQMGTNVMKGLAGATANLYNDAGYFDRPNGYNRDHNGSMLAIEEGSASTSTVSGSIQM